jgi:general secretion pathway protein I
VQKQRGVLLIELILAMLLISIALVSLMGGFQASIQAQGEIDRRTRARVLLEQKINELESEGVFQEGFVEGVFLDHDLFQWEMDTKKTELPALYRVKVTVLWPRNGKMELMVFLREREF